MVGKGLSGNGDKQGNELSGYITHTIVLLFFADVVQRVGPSHFLQGYLLIAAEGRGGGRVECYLRKVGLYYRYLHSPHQRMSLDTIIVFLWQR